MSHFVGIDPGVNGAIAIIDGYGSPVTVENMPTIQLGTRQQVNAAALCDILMEHKDTTFAVAIEKVSAMPKDGRVGAFSFGKAAGIAIGVVSALRLRIIDPTPQTWKKVMGLSSDKEQARGKAVLRYPTVKLGLKKDHNKAEALFLAEYARQIFHG